MSRLVLVDAGALEMVLNALTRDCEKGMLARGEMVAEIRKTVRPYEPVLATSLANSGLPRWEWSPPPDWDETKFSLDH